MSSTLDLLQRLRDERGAGGGSGNDPGPTRTRGTTPEAGGKRGPEGTGSIGRLPAPLPVEPVDQAAHERFLDELPARARAAAALEEGPREMQYPTCRGEDDRPPLWVLRKPNGKPNYASAAEQQRYLRESGWLNDKRAHMDARKGTGPTPWEEWVMELGDPRRVPPPDADPELLHELQLDEEPSPTERLAQATLDADELDAEDEWEFDTEGGEVHA